MRDPLTCMADRGCRSIPCPACYGAGDFDCRLCAGTGRHFYAVREPSAGRMLVEFAVYVAVGAALLAWIVLGWPS